MNLKKRAQAQYPGLTQYGQMGVVTGKHSDHAQVLHRQVLSVYQQMHPILNLHCLNII